MNAELETEIDRLGGEGEDIRPHDADIVDLAARLHARFPRYPEADILKALKQEWRRRGLAWKEA